MKIPFLDKGTLLIASPDVQKGLYARSVILLCEHNPSGSFGLLVNKPLEVELPEDILHLDSIVNPRITTWVGGPIQIGQMMLLHSSPSIPRQVLQICENVYLGGDLQFLQKSAADQEGPFIRLCFGYSGWVSGQLEKELQENMWLVQPSTEEYLFHTKPDKLWPTLVCNIKGDFLCASPIPEDLTLN